MGPRVAVAVLSLAAVPIDGGTVRADGAGPVLRLVWFDPSEIASGSESVARAETATLLARMGATVQWRRGTSGEVDRNDGVWVILVGEGPPDSGEAVLGATRKGHSAAPVVWVRVPNVQAAIGISRGWSLLGLRPDEQRRLAVALGRVIAHEVVHAVVPSVPHGTGLMSGGLSRRQLTAASISVELDVALALQAALRNNHLVVPLGTRTWSFRSSSEKSLCEGPVPMLAFTFVEHPRPMPRALAARWRLAGITTRPAATSMASRSGASPSAVAASPSHGVM